ncbi:hypothetical protein [Streptomyces sp. NPDC089919]|uniref:hypothetical protein n=1 Tax=Streptomyces sp. NPDC089919 TaxID=3155188 RepID=UPI00343D9E59
MPQIHRQTPAAAARRRRLHAARDRHARRARFATAQQLREAARRTRLLRRRDRRLVIAYLFAIPVAALFAVVAFTQAPVDRAAARAYRAAPECADADAAAAPEPEMRYLWSPVPDPQLPECIHQALFRARDVRIGDGGGGKEFSARLEGTTGGGGRVHFHGDGPVLRRLHDGDPVIGRVWRDEVVSIAADDRTQPTTADPEDDASSDIAAGAAFSAAGFAALLDATRRHRRLTVHARHQAT